MVLVGCSRANPPTPEKEQIQEGVTIIPQDDGTYFPTTVGTKWVYHYSTGEKQTLTIAKVEAKDNGAIVTVHEMQKDQSTKYYRTVRSSTLGLHRIDDRLREWLSPLWELKLPHQDGETWKVDARWKPKGEQITFEETWSFTAHGPEQITVPAGTFKTIRIVRGERLLQSEATTWYAPGVGIVKEVFAAGPRVRPERVEVVLTYFARGKQ